MVISHLHVSRDMTKPTKWVCTQRRLRSAWASAQSDQSLCCAQWVAKGPSFLHADSEDFDQTGRMPRLIWVFAGRTLTLLVLSCRGSCIVFVPLQLPILKSNLSCLVLTPKAQSPEREVRTMANYSSIMVLGIRRFVDIYGKAKNGRQAVWIIWLSGVWSMVLQ